jgi:hypothetical protein
MAAFSVDATAAAALLPGQELHVLRLPNGRGVLMVTVIDYRATDIGTYVEFSIAIACTHGARPWPMLPAALCMRRSGLGQYVWDLPVSSRISVKGGKGIWGMPKHQANLDFVIRDDKVWSQYDLDGELCCRIEVDRPRRTPLPISMSAVNYCAFRGMLYKSSVSFRGRAGVNLPLTRSARLTLGDHPRMAPLKRLGVRDRPLLAVYLPSTRGILDDHVESWFLTSDAPPEETPEGLESVAALGLGQERLAPPDDPEARRDSRFSRRSSTAP